MNIFSSDNLFNAASGAPPVAFGIMTGAFAVIFLISALAYWRRAKLAPTNPILRRFIRRAAKAAMWTSAIALFFAAMRYLEVPYLDPPIWLYLSVLAMIVTVGYFVYDRSERYPLAMWQLRHNDIERKYRPMARPRPEPVRQRSTNVRGKRRR